MSEIFDRLNKELNKGRADLSFSPMILIEMPQEERKIVESKIIKRCKLGDNTCYKFIPYLTTIDPLIYLSENDINKLPSYDQAEIYKYFFERSQDGTYLNDICLLALEDIKIFKLALNLYSKMKDSNIKQSFRRQLFHVERYVENSKELYTKVLSNRLLIDESKTSSSSPENQKMFSNNILDGILGFAIGDALGVPVEFTSRYQRKRNPVKDMWSYGTHHVSEGTWSDDTSMMLATMDSIVEKGTIDINDMMKKFCEWANNAKYTATNKVFDIGITTRNAIHAYNVMGISPLNCGIKSENSNGNGSLMRILPIAYYMAVCDLTEEEEQKLVGDVSSLTHAHEISKMGCHVFCDYIKELLNTGDKQEAYLKIQKKNYLQFYSSDTVDKYSRILNDNIGIYDENKISSSGYVVHTLEASLWATLTSSSYEDAVCKAVNLGEDTDTIGALTGAINGILYGKNQILY